MTKLSVPEPMTPEPRVAPDFNVQNSRRCPSRNDASSKTRAARHDTGWVESGCGGEKLSHLSKACGFECACEEDPRMLWARGVKKR
eukprot:785417-Amphidinium_carterae.1